MKPGPITKLIALIAGVDAGGSDYPWHVAWCFELVALATAVVGFSIAAWQRFF